MTQNASVVFCKICVCEQHWDAVNVYPVRILSEMTGLTKYAVRKAITELREAGLVQRTCVGRPAVEAGYEYKELAFEAMPPLHGFGLTKLATETKIFKEAERENEKALKEWAERI